MNHLHPHYSTEFENFVDVPVRSLVFLLKKLKLFNLFQSLIPDSRAKKGTYSMASLLMVSLQMLLFRSPSKNDFYQNKKLGREKAYHNLSRLAGIEGNYFPHSKTIDDAFWNLNPVHLEPFLFQLFHFLRSSKLFKNHSTLKKTVLTIFLLMLSSRTLTIPVANTPVKLVPIV